jgi:hypothetical protein
VNCSPPIHIKPLMRCSVSALLLVVLLAAGCGSQGSAKPDESPRVAAVRVLDQIVHNHYTDAWGDLHSVDQKVAPLAEYVGCETRSPVIARPRSVKVVSVNSESVGLGDGKFVESTAVDIRMAFAGSFSLVHTIHLVAEDGKWKWILPSWRFRDYKADRCPTDAGSKPPPANA